ncbi:glycosyltransferase family 2 protein [Methylotuvimicrobium buryatense]|uniref:Glycosyltransferase n=2 Tax=Methylotuvimicrobium buryatense TaxID=95641 RepID=A0A4P9UY12_METBY|nr:glycosyltransferase family 2 protein [Methylotuvimicrobium buryatense]QCW84746.1 glycosyltransferase [Methylotuvimicrobium buryatense]
MSNSKYTSVSVVVPVYNSEQTLPELIARLREVLSPTTEAFEVILVNDCSKDNSWQVIEKLAEQDTAVLGLSLMRNYGQHNALLAGIMRAQYDFIVTIDDDLQNPPEDIPKLLDALVEGHDVAYGKPQKRKHSLWRNLSSKIVKGSLRLALGADMGSKSSAFRAFRSDLRKGFTQFADAQVSIDVLLSWTANRIAAIKVAHQPRQHGRSGYTMRKLLSLTLSMVTGYSTAPLRFASSLGLFSALVGVGIFLYVLILRFVHEVSVPGFTFIAAEIAMFAGMQLFTIGVIGEYLARLHFRTMGKPPYTIRSETTSRTHQPKNN